MSEVRIKINFDIKDPSKTVIETNVKKEAIGEVLAAFVQGQAGEGKDESPPNEKDTYVIDIGLDLADDTFHVNSDTGNKSLTCGIVACLLGMIDVLEVKPL